MAPGWWWCCVWWRAAPRWTGMSNGQTDFQTGRDLLANPAHLVEGWGELRSFGPERKRGLWGRDHPSRLETTADMAGGEE